jgi:hypothetical protein
MFSVKLALRAGSLKPGYPVSPSRVESKLAITPILVWCPNDGFTGTHGHDFVSAQSLLSFPRKRESSPVLRRKDGFRIKSGMTDTVNLLLRHYTSPDLSGEFLASQTV